MATSSPGIGSGLDINAIVNQLVAVERQPLQKLQAKASSIQTQISSWGKLQSLVDSLRTSTTPLSGSSTWSKTQVSSTDPSVVAATQQSGETAITGRYSVAVSQLAQQHVLNSAVVASNADLRGNLRIELGSYDSAVPPNFSARAEPAAIDLSFTDSSTTLQMVRDAINAANGGVVASVLTDGSGSRLVVSSAQTGADRALKITVSGTTSGLNAFQFDRSSSSQMSQARVAQDAQYTVNGVALSSPLNQIDGSITGVRLTLAKVSTTPVDMIVQADASGQQKSVEDFVTAYNAVMAQLNAETSFDGVRSKAGVFQGDSSALNVRRRLRDLIGESSTASSVYGRLSEIGIDIKRDGTLEINRTRLESAMGKPEEVGRLMSASGSGTEQSKGLAVRLKQVLDNMLTTDGDLDAKSNSLQERLKKNQSDQERMNAKVEATRARLLKVYQALDVRVSNLNGLSSYVDQQFNPRR